MKYALPSFVVLLLGIISLSFLDEKTSSLYKPEVPDISAEEVSRQFIQSILDGKCDDAMAYCDADAKKKCKEENRKGCLVLSPNTYISDIDVMTDTLTTAVSAVFTNKKSFDTPFPDNRFYFIWMVNDGGEWRITDYFYVLDKPFEVPDEDSEEMACEEGSCDESACEESACEGACDGGEYFDSDEYY